MNGNPYLGVGAPILKIMRHTDNESTFVLGTGLGAQPGQFVMVSMPRAGECPFAVSGTGDGTIEVTVRKVGQVTSALFACSCGDTVYVRGPYGQPFPPRLLDAEHLLVIAGGSALTAVKMLIDSYLAKRKRSRGQLNILVGFRTPRHVLFKKNLKIWAKNCHQVIVTVDTNEGEEEQWMGGIGFVVDYIKRAKNIGPPTHAVVAGPPLMMKNCVNELLRHGINEGHIWVSFERHMKCGIGKCGHCRIGEKYVCLDGPVFNYPEAKSLVD